MAPPLAHADEVVTANRLAEMRRAFTVDGKSVPPELFRDFGDGDMADSRDIWGTVDVNAAIGSNLYFDGIQRNGAWVVQKKSGASAGAEEETAYTYIGETANGLLVA